jgi:fibronectin-binding autotransporter adhesin
MKSRTLGFRRSVSLVAMATLAITWTVTADDIYKENNAHALNLGSSWENGLVPTATDVANWDSYVLDATETALGANLSWLGIRGLNPGGPVTITGTHTLTVGAEGISLPSFGPVFTINTPVVLGADQIWSADAGRSLVVNGPISGSHTLTRMGNGSVTLSGTVSNTFTTPFVIDSAGGSASTSHTFFGKTGGAFAIPANGSVHFGIGAVGASNLRMLADNQFGPGVNLHFANTSGNWARFDLFGTDQTLAGLQAGTATVQGGAVIQNREISSAATHGLAVLTLNCNLDDPNYPAGGYLYNGYLRDADSGDSPENRLALVKNGSGTQAFAGNQIHYEGGTTVNGGILDFITPNSMDNPRGGFTVNAGAILRFATAQNMYGGLTMNGGTLVATGAPLANYGNLVLQGGVTIGGSATSHITCDVRIGSEATQTFNVQPTGDPSGIDLDFSGAGRLGHLNNLSWGYMTKTGAGTLRFNNPGDIGRIANNGGKIIFNESFAGLGNGGMINNAEVEIINSTDVHFAQPFYGTGNLVKKGDGKLTLSGANSAYSGTTEIAAGELQFGSGGPLAIDSSSILANGDLTFDHSNLVHFEGDISGSGSVIKTGSGTLVLTGALSYTGETQVNGGILSIPGSFNRDLAVATGGGYVGGDSVNSLSLASADYHSTGKPLTVDGALSLSGDNFVYLHTPPAMGSGDIVLMTYGGALTGGAANLSFPQADIYRGTPSFSVGAGQVKLSGLVFKTLVWTGVANGGPATSWDILTTPNWSDGGTPETFATGDAVIFDDSGINRTVVLPEATLISPSRITITNSAGNDYVISGNGADRGFTGATSIVKNGTGTATIQGYGHNYTGTVTINGGVLQPDGNFEMLGNSSGIIINTGGQLNINGSSLGNGVRHYSISIAGAGPNGQGAVTNSSATGPASNVGLLNLTLTADATVGGNGGRFDFGRSGSLFGVIDGGGHTLTKVGTGVVTMRGAAKNITYVCNGGTLKFEDNDSATGTQPITINAGTLQGWGPRTFSNQLLMAGGTTIDAESGVQTWTGDVEITSPGILTLSARGSIILTGAISGDGDITKSGANSVQMLGAKSNTYAGTLRINSLGSASSASHLYFGKTGGAVAVPAGSTVIFGTGTTGESNLRMLEDNQFGTGVRMDFNNASGSWSRLDLLGTDQELAGINTGTATILGGGVIQNREIHGTANRGTSVLTLNGNLDDPNYPAQGYYLFNGHLRDADSGVNALNKLELVKNGTGTQVFAGANISFSGDIVVNRGTLMGTSARSGAYTVFGHPSNERTITVSAGGTLVFGAANMFGNHNTIDVPTLVINGGVVTNADPGLTDKVNNGLNNVVLNNGTLTSVTGNSLSEIDDTRPDERYGAWGLNGNVTSSGTSTISTTSPAGLIMLGSRNLDNIFDVLDGTLEISAPLQEGDSSVPAKVIKNGAGTLVLSGTNVYTTDTIVNAGSFVLAESGSLRFRLTNFYTSAIRGEGNVTLNGNFAIETDSVTEESGSWQLVETDTLSVSYGSTFTLGAGWTNNGGVWSRSAGSQKWTFNQATGELSLTQLDGSFSAWAASFGLTGANSQPLADPDGDGISNALEMVLGGDPSGKNDSARLPTIQLVANPTGLPAGSYVLFTYRRTDSSVAAGLTSSCQYGSDLTGPWLTAANGAGGVTILIDNDFGGFSPAATGATDRVRVYIPKGTSDTLFGRLSVVVP